MSELLACPVSPTAKEAAAPLIESWIPRYYEEDCTVETLAVECGFSIWIDNDLLVIGVQDRIARDGVGPFGCEWKTAKEPKKDKNGNDTAWWNEDVWLRELVNGPQLAIYALAANKGTYYPKGTEEKIVLGVSDPRIMVRAAVKASLPRFWPSDPSKGTFQFPNGMLAHVENALKVRAAQIRASRDTGLVPWQLPGDQCMKYGRECQFAEKCREHDHPVGRNTLFNAEDPAYQLALANVDPKLLENPNLVILSASAYKDGNDCLEKFRILNNGLGPKDESLALDTGSAFHAGIAGYYRQFLGK